MRRGKGVVQEETGIVMAGVQWVLGVIKAVIALVLAWVGRMMGRGPERGAAPAGKRDEVVVPDTLALAAAAGPRRQTAFGAPPAGPDVSLGMSEPDGSRGREF